MASPLRCEAVSEWQSDKACWTWGRGITLIASWLDPSFPFNDSTKHQDYYYVRSWRTFWNSLVAWKTLG